MDWETDSVSEDSGSGAGRLRDLRFAGQAVWRRASGTPGTDPRAAWDRLRIDYGVAESGSDYQLSDAFPHDVLLDQNDGVGFRKGCYVGQEVVSRMQHRGTARRRILIATADVALPAPGTEVTANGRSIGSLGTVDGRRGLAMVRIDRVKDAMDAGVPVLAGDATLDLTIPPDARFSFSTATDAGDA